MNYEEINEKIKNIKYGRLYLAYLYWNNIYELVFKQSRKKIFH